MSNTAEYSRGYQAGKRRSAKDIALLVSELKATKVKADEREERVFMRCLEMALQSCNNWTIGKKTVDNAERYCALAKVFADNAISQMDK